VRLKTCRPTTWKASGQVSTRNLTRKAWPAARTNRLSATDEVRRYPTECRVRLVKRKSVTAIETEWRCPLCQKQMTVPAAAAFGRLFCIHVVKGCSYTMRCVCTWEACCSLTTVRHAAGFWYRGHFGPLQEEKYGRTLLDFPLQILQIKLHCSFSIYGNACSHW
jgi:hypothetical protein